MQALAIDVGGTHIKAALVTESGQFQHHTTIKTPYQEGPQAVLNSIVALIKQCSQKSSSICGVGIGMPGMVNMERTTISNPPNFPGWDTIPLLEKLQDQLSLNITWALDNDANAATLGSKYFGKGKAYSDFVLLTLGTGVGGGIIINNELYRGSHGMAGEIGHMIIQTDGPKSNATTTGTLEAYLGQRFWSKHAKRIIKQHTNSPLFEKASDPNQILEPRDIILAADSGDTVSQNICREAGRKLGAALVNLIHILDIRTFIFAGGVAQAGHWLFDPARNFIQQEVMPPFRNDIQLLVESDPSDLGLRGAAALVFDKLKTD